MYKDKEYKLTMIYWCQILFTYYISNEYRCWIFGYL